MERLDFNRPCAALKTTLTGAAAHMSLHLPNNVKEPGQPITTRNLSLREIVNRSDNEARKRTGKSNSPPPVRGPSMQTAP